VCPRAALSGAGFAPLPLDIYAVYLSWSMQKKLHDQREVRARGPAR
jgi:hypothetical protein